MAKENLELKEKEIYNGFKVLEIAQIPEYNSIGIFLKHENTGLEIFHMLNEDEENLFAFGFKTPSSDSKGTAHIIEHSVLCGSKNYPLKDPFIRLSNQSIKTFLNAMTFSDKTVYPASSINETDYFNLMAVYGDAVFFPLLTKETFMQEACRLEFDKNGKLQFQGVVFNEMKGDYSSLSNVITTYLAESLFPDSSYHYDSGGNPTCIPDLTYEQFLEFHKFYYHPSNCKLFLYGNISTKKQLDFINEKFLSKISEKPHPNFDEDKIDSITFSKDFDKPKYVTKFGPVENASKLANVVLAWKSVETLNQLESMELLILFQILLGHDGSPLYREIIKSGLCEDITAKYTESSLRYLFCSIGVRGVKKGKELAFEKFVLEQLNKIATEGISQDNIESALMSVEFMQREITRGYGPYSLVLMRRAYRAWMNGGTPASLISSNKVFEQVKENIKTKERYLEDLIYKYLINNKNRLCLTVLPDKNFNKKIEKTLQNKIKSICNKIQKKDRKNFFEQIKIDNQKLTEYQQLPEEPELCNLIPHLSSKELAVKVEKDSISQTKLLDVDVYENQATVNGIVYFDLCFPVDLLEPKDYKFLPFYSSVLTDLGFDGKSWIESSSLSAKYTGGLRAYLLSTSITPFLKEKANAINLDNQDLQKAMYEYDANVNRNWLVIRMSMLEEKSRQAINMLFSLIKSVDFSDLERLLDLLIEYKNDYDSSIIDMGHSYAITRASCNINRVKCIDEIWNGLTQLFDLHSEVFAKENIKNLKETLERIHQVVVNSGFIVHITAENSGLEKAKSCLASEINQFPFYKGKVKSPYLTSDDEFYALSDIQGKFEDTELFVVSSQVGFMAKVFKSSPLGTKECVLESLFAHWLSNKVLWEQLRTIGGCYGAFASLETIEGVFSLATYRDPNPIKSKAILEYIFDNIEKWQLDEVEFERIKTGCYSKEIQPRSPYSKSNVEFIRSLCGITYEYRLQKISILLNSSLEELFEVGKTICERSKSSKNTIIFTKTEDFTSKIVNLPL